MFISEVEFSESADLGKISTGFWLVGVYDLEEIASRSKY